MCRNTVDRPLSRTLRILHYGHHLSFDLQAPSYYQCRSCLICVACRLECYSHERLHCCHCLGHIFLLAIQKLWWHLCNKWNRIPMKFTVIKDLMENSLTKDKIALFWSIEVMVVQANVQQRYSPSLRYFSFDIVSSSLSRWTWLFRANLELHSYLDWIILADLQT